MHVDRTTVRTWGSGSTSSHVGQYRRCGRAAMYFMYRRHLPHLDSGLPVARGVSGTRIEMALHTRGLGMHAKQLPSATPGCTLLGVKEPPAGLAWMSGAGNRCCCRVRLLPQRTAAAAQGHIRATAAAARALGSPQGQSRPAAPSLTAGGPVAQPIEQPRQVLPFPHVWHWAFDCHSFFPHRWRPAARRTPRRAHPCV